MTESGQTGTVKLVMDGKAWVTPDSGPDVVLDAGTLSRGDSGGGTVVPIKRQ